MEYERALNEYFNYININLKPTTTIGIVRIFKNHITPHFSGKDVFNITSEDYYKWCDYIKNKNISANTNDNIYYAFKGFFDYLEKIYGTKNVAVKYGKIKLFEIDNKQNICVWNMQEFKKFINVVEDPVYKCFFNLLFFTGLRKGEISALRFTDLIGDKVNVNKSLSKDYFNGKRIELKPKTKKSERQILINSFIKKEIIQLKRYYITKYDNFNDNFYIFGGIKPLAPTTILRKKNIYCKLAGVKQIRIHDFRHSHASLLYKNNVSVKFIQERLGHSDISTTLNTYVHLNEDYEKKVLRTLFLQKLL